MKNPTYKDAVKLAGRLRCLAEICEVDPYWEEKNVGWLLSDGGRVEI